MASKTIEEFLKTASVKHIKDVQETGKGLQRDGLKEAPKGFQAEPVTKPHQGNTKEGKLGDIAPNESTPEKNQRGAQLIQQKMDTTEKTKATDQGKELDKSGAKDVANKTPANTPSKER